MLTGGEKDQGPVSLRAGGEEGQELSQSDLDLSLSIIIYCDTFSSSDNLGSTEFLENVSLLAVSHCSVSYQVLIRVTIISHVSPLQTTVM